MSTRVGFLARLIARWREWRSALPASLTQEQLAALMQRAWSAPPAYRRTQDQDPPKARATWVACCRWYLLHHQVRSQGNDSTATRITDVGRGSYFQHRSIRRSA